jgi:hypothetical protein
VARDGFVRLVGLVALDVSRVVVAFGCDVVTAIDWLAGLAPTVTAIAWLVEEVTIDPSSNMYRFKTKFHDPLACGAIALFVGKAM